MDKTYHHVMIFGATSGIAIAFARLFAGRKAVFTLIARDPEKLKDISADLLARGARDVKLCAVSLDDIRANHDATVEIIRQTYVPHTVLIAHGQLGEHERLTSQPQAVQDLYQVNVLSTIGILMALEDSMGKRGKGRIAVISSVAGDRGRASNYVYGSTKAAISTFTSGLRARLAPKGVRVLTVKPGMVATAMTDHLPRSPLMAEPGKVAKEIVAALLQNQNVLYTPGFWRWIMLVIKVLPERVFMKLKF